MRERRRSEGRVLGGAGVAAAAAAAGRAGGPGVVGAALRTRLPAPPPPPPPATTTAVAAAEPPPAAATAARGLGDLRRGVAQRRGRPRRPRARRRCASRPPWSRTSRCLQPAGDDDPHAAGERLGDVLRLLRQTEQRMKRVSPSFHSLVCRSNRRGVDATVKFATAAPDGVNRSSGSFVRLPMMVMTVSPAMWSLLSSGCVVGVSVRPGSDKPG